MRKILPFILIFAVAISLGGCMSIFWKGNAKSEVNTYEFGDVIDSVYVETTSFDVKIVKGNGNKTTVICREADILKHDVEVKNGMLRIIKRKSSGSVNAVNIQLEIEVQLPDENYSRIEITTKSGDISVASDFALEDAVLHASSGGIFSEADVTGTLDVETSSGSQHISNVYGRMVKATSSSGSISMSALFGHDVSAKASSGDVTMKDVVIKGKLDIRTSSGDVGLSRCDAGEIEIETSSGDVNGELLSGKDFKIKTSSGNVKVPESSSGSICRIKTSSGDIRITVR